MAAAVTETGSVLTSSMYRDVVAGRPTESEYILGDLVARGRSHGAEVGLLDMAAVQLRVHDARAAGAVATERS